MDKFKVQKSDFTPEFEVVGGSVAIHSPNISLTSLIRLRPDFAGPIVRTAWTAAGPRGLHLAVEFAAKIGRDVEAQKIWVWVEISLHL